jgi:hypothetical protein
MIQTNDAIETSVVSARRRTTGAIFSLNLVPPEFSEFECEYENPKCGQKIGFHARWIYEQKVLERSGKLVPWPLCTGAILIEGELKQRLETVADGRASEGEIDGLVQDCYELIAEFIKGQREFNHFGIEAHIYVAEARRFGFLNLHGTQVEPEAIAASQAKLVF